MSDKPILKITKENLDDAIGENHRFCMECKAIIPDTSKFYPDRDHDESKPCTECSHPETTDFKTAHEKGQIVIVEDEELDEYGDNFAEDPGYKYFR